MTDRLDFEARLGERLRARAAVASRPFDAAAIARQAVAGKRRRRWIGWFEPPSVRPAAGLLLVALLLATAVLAAVAGIGALRLLQGDPARKLGLETIIDVPAFIASTYDRMPELPPVALTWLSDGTTKGRIYVDSSGAVRFEQYASAAATEPATYRILSGSSVGWLERVGSEHVWVVQREAISEDPRVFILAEIASRGISFGEPGCDVSWSADDGGSAAAAGWILVGDEDVAGRPAHHVTCGSDDLWLDGETQLILRARVPRFDDAGRPIEGEFRTFEMTEVAFGEQPPTLFYLAPPTGVPLVPAEELEQYRCEHDGACSATPLDESPGPTDPGVPGSQPAIP